MTPTEKHREPDAWRYRYEQKPGVWGKWTVQKNKPSWWRPEQPDVQLEPLFSEAALANAEREGVEAERERAAKIAERWTPFPEPTSRASRYWLAHIARPAIAAAIRGREA